MRAIGVIGLLALLVGSNGWAEPGEEDGGDAVAEDAVLAEVERLSKEGWALLNSGAHAQAKPLFERALFIVQATADTNHFNNIVPNIGLGLISKETAAHEKAMAFYARALDISETNFGREHLFNAKILTLMGDLLLATKNYQSAKPILERKLAILESKLGPAHPDTQSDRDFVARILEEMGEFLLAKDLFERSLILSEAQFGPNHPGTSDRLKNLAMLHRATGAYKKAQPLLERALEIQEKHLGPNHPDTVLTLNILGSVVLSMADYPAAKILYERALEIQEKHLGPDHPDTVVSLGNLGLVLSNMGDYTAAKTLHERALEIQEKHLGPNHPDTAFSLNNLGSVLSNMGDYTAAKTLHERALEIQEKHLGPNHPDTVRTLSILGSELSNLGDYAAAKTLHERALEIREKHLGPNHPDTASSLQVLAGALWDLDDAQAKTLYVRALEIREKHLGPNHPDTVNSLQGVARVLWVLGNLTAAKTLFEHSLEIKEKHFGPNHPYTATCLNILAEFLYFTDAYEKARPIFERALEIRKKHLGPNHPDTVNSLANMAMLHLKIDAKKQALALAHQVETSQEHHLQRNLTASEKSRQTYFDTFRSSTHFILSLHFDHMPHARKSRQLALQTWLRRKGRILDAQVNTITKLRRNLDEQGQQLLNRWHDLRVKEAQLVNQVPEEGFDPYRQTLQTLAKQIEQAEQDLAQQSNVFAATQVEVNSRNIQRKLPPNTALLQYAIYRPYQTKDESYAPPHLAAFLLQKNGKIRSIKLGPMADLEPRLEAFRQTRSDTLARWLYDHLVAPIAPNPQEYEHLLISPDGPLNLIPFEALQNQEGTTLLDTLHISYLSTGRDLLRLDLHDDIETGPPMVLAAPAFQSEGQWAALPGTAAEAEVIQNLYPATTVHTGHAAALQTIRTVDSPEFLHIATHGFYVPDNPQNLSDNNPMTRSGLILAETHADPENRLLASETATLDLDGTRLVVLSACETGLGQASNGEGVYGLRRALAIAGSRSQLVSLWPVNDAATAVFMTGLYTRIKDGMPLGQAVQLTRKAMRDDGHGVEEWAPFVLTGDWR